MNADHRRAERFSLQLPATIQPFRQGRAEDVLDLVTSDVCSGGAYFRTDKPLPLGTEVKIDMILPLEKLKNIKEKQVHIRVSGDVVRITENGMAVCFDKNCIISPFPQKNK